MTVTYKLSVTNLEFTLGLTENKNNFFLPMSLRVEDSSIEKSNGGEVVDFIFSKDMSISKYEKMLVEDKHKIIPEGIRHLIKDDFEKTKKGSFKNKAKFVIGANK